MLGYISSTRKKSCQACVKSKRRCDLGYPSCKRCSSKNIECTYPNAAAARETEVVVRQSTPDLAPLDNDLAAVGSQPDLPPTTITSSGIDSALLYTSPGDSCSSSSSDQSNVDDELGFDVVSPTRLSGTLRPQIRQIWEPTILSEHQVVFLVNKLCSIVPSMALAGHTPFMHERMYECWQPQAYQDSCAISALYMMKTPSNIPILTKSIDGKISALIATSHSWSLAEHLAAVQSLIMYQIIRLFDPDLNLQDVAARQNTLLAIWSAHLWKRYFNEVDPTDNCYDSWIFQESLRRTVFMSVFLRGIWSSFTRGGYCDQVPVLAKLPVTRDGMLWISDNAGWNARAPCTSEGGRLISYGDLSSGWSHDQSVHQLPDFERMLLAACRGRADPRLTEDA